MPEDAGSGRKGTFRDKLIATKEKWAREGRLLTGRLGLSARDRLPPGQRLVNSLPILDLGVQPHVDLAEWRLVVDGEVENPLDLDWDAFQEMPQTDLEVDIHCVTAWSTYSVRWRGVRARDILERVSPKASAGYVLLHSYDGYTTNLALDMFDDEDVLIAHSLNGAPLPREHGGPVRAVLPKRYFWKSAKWIRRIEFMNEDKPGFWEARGYHNEGEPWSEERYDR